ncbi:MAG TPA: alkaline phosphatase family protein, partial [Acidimicrobiales bacterium]|nr:alkaline phosphatase family protein [Acidimicrobiales bacterium]
MATPVLARASAAEVERALAVLLDPALEPIVDLVAWSPAPGAYEVASAQGHVRARRRPEGTGDARAGGHFEVDVVHGENPVARQDPGHRAGLDAERSAPHPGRADNSYPHAFDQLAQLFDHPSAPDLVVQHSASHYWGDQGGHLGEHGSMGVVQARAPFVAAGAGLAARGPVDESCRLVDVAPTILELLGCGLAHHDGTVLRLVVPEPGGASQVVAFLLDGTNANVLYDLAGRGRAPNIARLMEMGTTYRHGALASLPTVTLANHTSILTGCHPGHHGILHNAWIDRASGDQVVTNSPSTWPTAMVRLDPSVETIHQALHRARP